jgi:hypothetical protein
MMVIFRNTPCTAHYIPSLAVLRISLNKCVPSSFRIKWKTKKQKKRQNNKTKTRKKRKKSPPQKPHHTIGSSKIQ